MKKQIPYFTFLQLQNLNKCKHSLEFYELHSLGGSRLDRPDPIETNGSFASTLFSAKIYFLPSFLKWYPISPLVIDEMQLFIFGLVAVL